MSKFLVFFFALFASAMAFCQVERGVAFEGPLSQLAKEENKGTKFEHSSIYPLSPGLDTALIKYSTDSTFFKNPKAIKLAPSSHLIGAWAGEEPMGILGLGVNGKGKISERIGYRFNASMYAAEMPDYLGSDSAFVIPGVGTTLDNTSPHLAPYLTGALYAKLGDHFSIEGGRDKHFWGDGFRSNVLSHNAAPFPYVRLTTKVWKVKYVNLWGVQTDVSRGLDESRRRKFTTMHMVSFNLHKRLNIQLFEAVVYQDRDTLSSRNVDLNYLNPIIFYRPVEFAQGSADNALLGAGFKYRIRNDWQLYGQVYFDEFLLFELRRRLGWWGNKFAIQIGAKKWDVLPGLNGLTEFNLARPYTYTHGSVFQAYGHLNQVLSHPLETNFVEWINHWTYQQRGWDLSLTYMWAIYGRDTQEENFGGNVFRSYANPARQYDNYLAQGLKSTVHFARIRAQKPIAKANINAFLELGYRYESNDRGSNNLPIVQVGLVSNLNHLPTMR